MNCYLTCERIFDKKIILKSFIHWASNFGMMSLSQILLGSELDNDE